MSTHEEDLELVDTLARIMESRGLEALDVRFDRGKDNRVSVRLSRTTGTKGAARPAVSRTEPDEGIKEQDPASTPEPTSVATDETGIVKSEMVGIAYLKSSPEASEPFVKIGSTVNEGDTLLIIEAMKTMNHILAPHSGTVMKIFVSDQEPVQYGTALMLID